MSKNPTLCLAILFFCSVLQAQPPKASAYTVANVLLPAQMNKQVCISGLKYYNGQLYFASERCPIITVFDPSKKEITRTINLNVPQEFEMEGMTSFGDKLYLVSEDIAAVYEVNILDGSLKTVQTSIPLPQKLQSGDGMEGIAANEKYKKFYLLRERNENLSKSQIYTFTAKTSKEGTVVLEFDSMFELPLENPQWRYSDICFDEKNNRLLCLKSYSKGRTRQQYLESITIDSKGVPQAETLRSVPVDNFTEVSNDYKVMDYSMNLEGISISPNGTIYIISDNTSGRADCDRQAKEKTVLLELKRNDP